MGIGSDWAYRMWGFLTSPLRVPMRFTIVVMPEDGSNTRVSVNARSDLGWYAYEWKRSVDSKYNQAFAALFGLLRRLSGSVENAVPP